MKIVFLNSFTPVCKILFNPKILSNNKTSPALNMWSNPFCFNYAGAYIPPKQPSVPFLPHENLSFWRFLMSKKPSGKGNKTSSQELLRQQARATKEKIRDVSNDQNLTKETRRSLLIALNDALKAITSRIRIF